ncbi:DUF2628 domain-containing protein [Terasakiella pusilla]|uniref:DUF2628 domain-containing protein n=1 Tax=Terasakiella pusilla TaxID=64973 RepID=UPI003AA7ACA9
MKLFSIHIHKYGLDPCPDIRAIKEGFNLWAAILTFFWAAFKGYWWVAGGLALAEIIISVILAAIGLDLFGQAVVNIVFNLLVGLYANDLARWSLARRGFTEDEVVSAVSAEHALERYVTTLH